MFRWEANTGFYLLLLIPVVILIYYLAIKNKTYRRGKFIDESLYKRLTNFNVNEWAAVLLLAAAIFFIGLAVANPQSGLHRERQKVEKSDIMIALDISNSMNARDISPSRLEKAKRLITEFIKSRQGDQIGLIFFAGEAYLQMPLTSDLAAAELFAKSANTNMAGTQGTVIAEAIQLAMQSVKEDHQRALIILSDGEDHDADAINMASKAADAGWSIFTVGVGTPEGGFIPVQDEGRETYKTDDEGNPIRTAINEDLLKSIASKATGDYYRLSDNERSIIRDMNTKLERIQKYAVDVKSYSAFESYYQYLLFPALMLVILGFFYDFKSKTV